ncbi:acid phosphatase 1-like [Typha latifolia]|uniref:acid phosphatase 1-like n=1 Tax=Typha latifolia TaxID=4733 RepID=UPI003C30B7FA
MWRFRCLLLFPFLLFLTTNSSQNLLEVVHGDGDDNSELSDGYNDLYCSSWRLAVETNDAGVWNREQERCIEYVKSNINFGQYLSDSFVVAKEALAFAKTVNIADDGMDAWIFDVDDTLISHVGRNGSKVAELSFSISDASTTPAALPASMWLYKELRELGFQLIFLSGRGEDERVTTVDDLLNAGYNSWTRLILREAYETKTTATEYKSQRRAALMHQGYRIRGVSGDQWSDLLGSPMATRSFKLPNPVYYTG